MEQHKILCSTGALIGRPNGRDFRLLTDLAPKLHCDGFEFMMYDSWYGQEEELVSFLRDLGLHIPIVHCEKTIGEGLSSDEEDARRASMQKFIVNCQLAHDLGAEKIVLHLWNGLVSDTHFENNLAAYGALRQQAEKFGLVLLVENVVCAEADPMRRLQELTDAYAGQTKTGGPYFVFDTKMAAFHHQMNLLYSPDWAWLWKEGHILHYHINDYAGGYKDWDHLKTLPIGAGQIDFEKFFAWLRTTGYTGDFTVEATAFDRTGRVDTDMLNMCFEKVRSFL